MPTNPYYPTGVTIRDPSYGFPSQERRGFPGGGSGETSADIFARMMMGGGAAQIAAMPPTISQPSPRLPARPRQSVISKPVSARQVPGGAGVSKPTKTVKAGRAPELETQMTDYISRLNEMSTGYQQAFQAKQNTFADVIRSLQNVYQQRAGIESAAQQQSALASGLTPLESTQLGQQALSQVLQQFYPQQAALKAQQADVPIAAQQAMQGVNQDYAAMLQGVLAPYYQGIAGTQEFDVLGQQQLATQQQQFGQQASMQQQAQQQDWQKTLLSAQLQQMGMSQQEAQFQAQLQQAMQMAQMEQGGAMQRAQLGETGATGRAGMAQAGAMQRAQLGEAGATGRAQMGITAQQQGATQQQQFQARQNLMNMLAQIGMTQMGVTGRREVAEIGAGARERAAQVTAGGRQTAQDKMLQEVIKAMMSAGVKGGATVQLPGGGRVETIEPSVLGNLLRWAIPFMSTKPAEIKYTPGAGGAAGGAPSTFDALAQAWLEKK